MSIWGEAACRTKVRILTVKDVRDAMKTAPEQNREDQALAIPEVRDVIACARLVLMSGANEREMRRLQTALFIFDNRDSPKARALAADLFADLR